MEFCIERPYCPSNSVRVMFLNFVFYERTGFLHVLKIGCCFLWFKQFLGRNITSLTRLRSCRYKFNFKITLTNSALIAWCLLSASGFFWTEVNMCKKQGYLLLANLLIRRQSARVKERWAFFKNRGSSCKRSLSLLPQLSRGQFVENRLGALLSNKNACYAGYVFTALSAVLPL